MSWFDDNPVGRTTDPNAEAAQIQAWSEMPGADPSLANDPTYWEGRINATGGLGNDNMQYWQNASVGPNAFFNQPNRESSSIGGMVNPNYKPLPSYQPPNAPQYQNVQYTPYGGFTPMNAPAPITLPTLDQLQNTPGYQFAQQQGVKGIQQAATPNGLSGGTLKAAADYSSNLASTYYQNAVNNALNLGQANFQDAYAVNQANNANSLAAYNANVGAQLGIGGLNLQGQNQQFQNTYQPSWNAYLSDVSQNQFGGNYGLSLANLGLQNSYLGLYGQNQNWNQGMAENQNAFNQYNTNQNNAFQQWLALAQMGNYGNPYA